MNDKNEVTYLQLLRKGAWFGALPASLQQRIFDASTVSTWRKRALLVRQGAPCRGLFAVLEGRVHVVRDLPDESEALVHVGEAGFWFGEYGLLSGQPAIANVVAVADVTALMLPKSEFGRIVADEPAFLPFFTRLLCERFATFFRYASEARTVPAEQWLWLRLQDFAHRLRLDAPGEGPVDIALSQAELANMVGVSRQTLCMLLHRLQERGLVKVAYKRVRVLDFAAGRRSAQAA